jgi:nucleoid DNA-binding protein
MNIFFDELVKEILTGNEIRIINFGTFSIKNLKGKRFRDIVSKKIALSKSTKALRFKISRNLSKYLSDKYYKEMKSAVVEEGECNKE